MNEAHPMAADKRPNAAVVVMVGEIEQVDGVIIPPIFVTDVDDRVEIGNGIRVVDAHAPHEAEGLAGSFGINNIIQVSEHVAKCVAAPAKVEGGHLGDEVAGIADGKLLFGKGDGLVNILLGAGPKVCQNFSFDGTCPAQIITSPLLVAELLQ